MKEKDKKKEEGNHKTILQEDRGELSKAWQLQYGAWGGSQKGQTQKERSGNFSAQA